MMFEKKLGKIGINKGIVVGVLFMILVMGAIIVSVKVVRGETRFIKNGVPSDGITAEDGKKYEPPDLAQKSLGDKGVTLKNADGTSYDSTSKEFTAKNGQVVKTEIMSSGTEIDGATGTTSIDDMTAKGSAGAKPISYDGKTLTGGDIATANKAVAVKTPVGNPAGMRCPSGSCGAGSASGGKGGSGAGGEGGGKGGPADEAFTKVSSMIGTVSSALAPLKAVLEAASKAAPPNIFYPQDAGEVTTTVDNLAAANIQDSSKTITLMQNNVNLPGNVKGTTLKDFTTGNSVIVVYGSVDAILVTPENKVTHVINDLSKGEPALSNKLNTGSVPINTGFLPLVNAEESITGEAIVSSPNQEIKLQDYDVGLSGEDLLVVIFKPFDKLSGKGTNLNLADGEVLIDFKNMKTNYPRLVKNNEFFINEIRNEYDTNNLFMLVPGGVKGNYLVDSRLRLTVGDAVVKNPLEGYENVNIPKTREAMWKKAAIGNW